MRYYSPYPLISSLRGQSLGQDEAFQPRRVAKFLAEVDPRSSDEAMKGYLAVWGQWAAARERTIAKWGSTIDDLIKLKAATCDELRRYNKAALLHWAREVQMAVRLIEAGAAKDQVPMPLFPVVFAAEMRFIEKGPQGRPLILHRLPCKKGDRFPDFSKLRIFGPPDQVEEAFTRPGQEQLSGFFALPVWAIVVISGLIAGTIVLSFRELRLGYTGEEVEKEKGEILRTEVESDAARAETEKECLAKSLAAIGRPVTPDEMSKIIDQCLNLALKVHPLRKGQKIGGASLGLGLLLGGLGIAAVIGSFTYFRRQQQK